MARIGQLIVLRSVKYFDIVEKVTIIFIQNLLDGTADFAFIFS